MRRKASISASHKSLRVTSRGLCVTRRARSDSEYGSFGSPGSHGPSGPSGRER